MEIKAKTVISVLLIVATLVIGFVVLGFMTDISPEIMPKYSRNFSTGSTPFTYDTGQNNLIDIVVTMYNYSASAWDTVDSANVSYSSETVTVADAWVNTTNHNTTTHINANQEIDTSLWAKLAGVIGFVIVICILFYIFKALPKKE